MARKTSAAQLDRETLILKDKVSGNRIFLTVRDDQVVGAMGSDPKRYMGLPVATARYVARYGSVRKSGKRSTSHLDRDVAASLSKKESLPRWSDRKGWIGGNSKTLYTYIDNVTDRIAVAPGGHAHVQVGPNAEVRMATRAEAEMLWQSPLHGGWKVAP